MTNVFKHFETLHAIPELGMEEHKTSAYVAETLRRAGYAVTEHVGGTTGVIGTLDSGNPGPTLALRSDMDALPKDGGAAHLCGHDAHMSMLLTAAEEIMAEHLVKKGKLKLLFQPAEELGTGAAILADAGAVDDVDILIGMHIRPEQECAVGQASPALLYSAAVHAGIEITGQQSHGARPFLGISALDAACLIVSAANTLRFPSGVMHNLKATQLIADAGASNIIPGTARLVFDLRSQDNAVMDDMVARLRRVAENTAASVGTSIRWDILADTPASIITPEITDLLGGIIREELGEAAYVPPITTAGGEDFFWYPKKKPGLKTGFVGLGAGAAPGLHHPAMHFDHSCLPSGVKIHKGAVKKILG